MTIGEKISRRRKELNITQVELAQKADLTIRSISKYETGTASPRGGTLRRLASALNVSEAYLLDPEITDPEYGKEEAPYVDEVRDAFGRKAGADMQKLLAQTVTMFAGGEVPQEDKDAFYEAVKQAYTLSKRTASERYNPHKNGR